MQRDDDSLDLPAGLKGELRGMYEPGQRFDGSRDAGILRAAHAAGGRHGMWRRWVLSGAAAAAIAMAGGVTWYVEQGHEAAGVYARNGDIRDAFYVARELKGHRAVGKEWDENHDGVVDDRDVRALAMAAVRVGREGGGR